MARIALLFEYPTLNGGERSMLQSLEHVPDEFEIVAVAPPSGLLAAELADRSIRHVPIELRDQRGIRLPREVTCDLVTTAIDHVRPDLIHANSLSMGRLVGALTDRLTMPCVAHLRDILKLSRAAIADLSRNNALIAVSAATRQFHIEQGVSAALVRVIHNGVDCERFRPRAKTGGLRDELGLPTDCFLLLTVGQIGLRKGQDVLAEAAREIVQQVPSAHFVLAGQRDSNKEESRAFERDIVSRLEQSGLRGRLHLLGYRTDVAWLMNEADLLLHPAKQEPLGRVLLEAAASGLPIVATEVGGTNEIVRDSESARLVTAGEARELAEAVCELASDDRLRERYGVAARQNVATNFTPEHAANGMTQVWRERLR